MIYMRGGGRLGWGGRVVLFVAFLPLLVLLAVVPVAISIRNNLSNLLSILCEWFEA